MDSSRSMQATSLNRSNTTTGYGVSSVIQSASDTDFVSIGVNLAIIDRDSRCVKHLDPETNNFILIFQINKLPFTSKLI
jgi:hypothetical protein